MFVDRRQASVWREIERYDLAVTAPAVPQNWRWHRDGELRTEPMPVPDDELGSLERAWVHVSSAAARVRSDRPWREQELDDLDVPLARLFDDLRLGPWTLALCQAALGEQISGDWTRASALDLLANIAAAGGVLDFFRAATFAYEFTDGTGSLIDALARDGDPEIRTGEPVRQVAQGDGGVRVRTDRGDYRARLAVSALPLNVLAHVDMQPALDGDRARCVDHGHVGGGVKVWAIAEPVPDGLLAYSAGTALQLVAYDRALEQGALLVGFGSGPLDGNDPEAVQAALAPVLPGVVVHASCGHDWVGDPFSRGTWAVQPAGTAATWQALPGAHGRVVFASGDIGPRWAGYIDGAVDAGAHAAATALSLL
jgi:monoamine oxidase